ncbi:MULTISPECIES: hypothetical protein [unclassified Kribbella]|uniref:hypothetical protein n=1 Tax=unclassified Kribbella TaxID=2644121 RepID=UPI00301B0E79
MENLGARHRPNVLFNLVGVLLIVAGCGLTIYGLATAVEIVRGFDPFRGDGPPVAVADGMALAFWGIIVFTIGRYFWRGARKRGGRDRFGRLLIIVGYLLLGVGLDGGLHAAAGLMSASSEATARSAVIEALITTFVWGVPGSILAAIGFRLADEKALAKASVRAEF